MALHIAETETGYAFSGDTYNFRDLIKALPGARWAPATKTWTAPKGADLSAIRARLAEHEASRAAWAEIAKKNAYLRLPREEWTKEQWQEYRLNWNKRGSVGKCCKHAVAFEEYEQGPICYRCEKHGVTHNNWTGD